MFCPNCGANLTGGSKFCPKCGTRIGNQPRQQEPVGQPQGNEMPNAGEAGRQKTQPVAKPNGTGFECKKKLTPRIIGIIVAAAVIIAAIIVLIIVLGGGGKVSVDLNQYVRVSFSGYDTVGTAEYYFDTAGFTEEYSGKIKLTREGENSGLEAQLSSMGMDPAVQIANSIYGSLDRTSGLSNGDTVTFSWHFNSENIETNYNVNLKYDDIKFDVTGLEEAELFDPFEDVRIAYIGVSSKATAKLISENPLLSSDDYELSKTSDIEEGDVITVSLSEKAVENLQREGITPTATSKQFTVEGLSRSLAEDLLENVGDDIIDSGYCGDDMAWTLDENGLLTIAGSGDMYNYVKEKSYSTSDPVDIDTANISPWGGYVDSISRVEMSDGITGIGNGAFLHCENMTEAVLPNTLETIGSHAFRYSGVKNIDMPDSVTTIGSYSFYNCAIEQIRFSENLTEIPESAFWVCPFLTEVTIPGSVTEIGGQAFSQCESLATVNLNEGLESIDYWAFMKCPIHNITFPSTVTDLGDNLFWEYSDMPWESDYNNTMDYVIDVTFKGDCPDSLYSPFREARVNVYYPSNNETWTSQIDSLKINADEVNLIPYEAEPTGLCGENVSWSVSSDGTLNISGSGNMYDYTEDASAPWISYKDAITSIVVDSGVTGIGKGAFKDCTNATTITFNGDAPTFGAGCFQNLTLTAYYPGNNETWNDEVRQDRGGNITWEAR